MDEPPDRNTLIEEVISKMEHMIAGHRAYKKEATETGDKALSTKRIATLRRQILEIRAMKDQVGPHAPHTHP